MKFIKFIFFFLFLTPAFVMSQDVYEIKWETSAQIKLKAALIVDEDNGEGIARVKWDENMVEQTFTVENKNGVLQLIGSYPVYPGTLSEYPSYNADNFYITTDENGNYTCLNIDNAHSVSKCKLRKIKNNARSQNNFLKEFDFSLDYFK